MYEVRSILWTLLIAATMASVAANVAHAVIRHGFILAATGPVLFAMLAPGALLGLFHLMSAWARAAGGRRWVFWFYLLSIVVLAGAAFRLSFAAIRDLAVSYGYGPGDAALFPLILDGLIAVCTVGLVAATRTSAPVVHHEPVGQPEPERVNQPEPSLVPDPEPTPLPAVVQPDHEPLDQPEPAPSPAVDQPDRAPEPQPVERSTTSDDPVSHPLVVQSEPAVNPAPVPAPDQAGGPHPEPRRLALVNRDPDRPVDHRALAEQVVARVGGDWTVELVEQVSRHTPGMGQRPLADQLGTSPSKVNRVRKALAEAAAETPDRAGEPALA